MDSTVEILTYQTHWFSACVPNRKPRAARQTFAFLMDFGCFLVYWNHGDATFLGP